MLLTRSLSSAIREAFRADFTSGFLDPRINFSRTTNATVTNSAGVIAYAPHNLLTASSSFDASAWTKTTTTVTSNSTVSPQNETTADTLTAGGSNSTTLHSYTAIAQSYVFSVWIKRRTGTGDIQITADGSTYVTKVITSSWVRYETAIVPTAGTRTPGIKIVTSGDAIDVWGAQLEIGTVAGTYNSTMVKNLLGYTEAFDNAAWTKSNSFVQTNLLTYSEAFDNAAWTAARVTFSANSVIAPNGYQTADKLIETATTGLHNVQQILTVTSGATYTLSIYAKAAERTILEVIDPYTLTGATFDLVNGTAGNPQTGGVTLATNRGIEPAANGFYRCYIRVTTAGTSLAMRAGLSDGSATSYAGNGTSGLIYWGAQIVGGSVAGDYRRTDAAALPVYYPNHNGVVCAEKLVESATTADHYIQESATAGNIPYTYSCYLKAGERTNALVVMSDLASGNATAIVNLSTGVVTSTVSGSWTSPIAQAVSVGNGYYRVSITATKGAGTSIGARTHIYTTASSYAGDGTSGIYIFGAQLSDSASLDPYVLNAAAAPTAAAYYGARFDYDPVTLEAKGLLIEEQRANLVTYSSDLQSVAYDYLGTTWAPNQVISPAGTTTAGKLAEDTSLGRHDLAAKTAIVTTAIPYTVSIYAKAAERSWFKLRFAVAGSFLGAYFNVSSGVVGTTDVGFTATITNVGNGYYRCTITTTAAVNSYFTGVRLASADNTDSYQGISGNGIYFYGLQTEAGAFATSYIPTAASQVTRAADVATIQGSNFYSWINQNAGSIYAQFSTPASGNRNIIALDDNTANNNIRLRTEGTDPYLKQAWVGTEQVALDLGTIAANTVYKIAASYQINDYAGVIANGTVGTDVVANTPIMTMMRLGTDQAGAYLNSTIKTFTYYPQKLSTGILKGLTA